MTFTDRFGILHLHDSAGIKDYYPSWDNGKPRTWGSKGTKYRNADPEDPFSDLHCKSGERDIKTTASVDGKGNCELYGTTPRLYFNDPLKKFLWPPHLEMTCYFTVLKKLPKGGAYVGNRWFWGNHQNEFECAACGTCYCSEAKASNGVWQQKRENGHPWYSDNIISKTRGLKIGVEYGHKFTIQRHTNGSVELATYQDLTHGKNGGEWKKINGYIDNGNWPITDKEDINGFNKMKSCKEFKKLPSLKTILNFPMRSVALRCDNVHVRINRASIIVTKPS